MARELLAAVSALGVSLSYRAASSKSWPLGATGTWRLGEKGTMARTALTGDTHARERPGLTRLWQACVTVCTLPLSNPAVSPFLS